MIPNGSDAVEVCRFAPTLNRPTIYFHMKLCIGNLVVNFSRATPASQDSNPSSETVRSTLDESIRLDDWYICLSVNEPRLGIRDLLQRKGFDILLLDEYRTSSRCPLCKSIVKPFKHRRTPRSWRGNDSPRLVHGLLKCGSEECRTILDGKERLWNRDLLATLNFRAILNGLRSGQGRPVYLARGN